GHQVSSLRFKLASDKNHRVYKAEMVGMILAVEPLKSTRHVRKVSLALDRKAAILTSKSFLSKPAHYLMDIFHANL
ncbi:hypothetical protein L210DRAFT_793453, partial [Boletus edulis BED1]